MFDTSRSKYEILKGFQFLVSLVREMFSTKRLFSSGIIPLHGKNYIEIIGKDTKKFLQGLITNDMNSLTPNQPILASALLNPKVTSINP